MKNLKIGDLSCMCEVSITYKRPLFDKMPHIKSSEDANDIIKGAIDLDCLDYKEFFWVLLLNNSKRVLGISEIGKGDTQGVVVNIKEIFQLVLRTNATAIIICHNHPSGNLVASKNDRTMTTKVKEISKLFSISLVDHLIITSENYYSFAEEGLL